MSKPRTLEEWATHLYSLYHEQGDEPCDLGRGYLLRLVTVSPDEEDIAVRAEWSNGFTTAWRVVGSEEALLEFLRGLGAEALSDG